MTRKPSQRYALLDILSAGLVLTMDQLITEVADRTGRTVKANSLTIEMSRLRNHSGYPIRTNRVDGEWTYRLRGKLERERAKREFDTRVPQPVTFRSTL